MNYIAKFTEFLKDAFDANQFQIDYYKEDLIFVDVDCLTDTDRKVVIEVRPDILGISVAEKCPQLPDFSGHDEIYKNIDLAIKDILKTKETGIYTSSLYNSENS